MLILGLLGMYFDAAGVFVTNFSLLFRSASHTVVPCLSFDISYLCRDSWYGLTEVDQNEIYFPTLQISGAKTIQRTRKYGSKDNDYFWFQSPYNLEYQQAIKASIYCSFDFQTYPFDTHYCDFHFVAADNTIGSLALDPPELRFGHLGAKT